MTQLPPVSPRPGPGLSATPADLFSTVWPLSARPPRASCLPPTASPAVRDELTITLETPFGIRGTQFLSGQTSIVHDGKQGSTLRYVRTRIDLQPPVLWATAGTWRTRPDVVPSDLKEALEDLEDTLQEADDEGFPPPTEVARVNAARLIHAMYRIRACRLEVYPTADGEVAIDAGASNRSVVLLCQAAGGALCLANTGATHRRAHYSDANELPDGFLREALAELVDQEESLE